MGTCTHIFAHISHTNKAGYEWVYILIYMHIYILIYPTDFISSHKAHTFSHPLVFLIE